MAAAATLGNVAADTQQNLVLKIYSLLKMIHNDALNVMHTHLGTERQIMLRAEFSFQQLRVL